MTSITMDERVRECRRAIRAASLDGIERRTLPAPIRAQTRDDGSWQIAGLGVIYNSLSENLGGFREIIRPGAATDVLAGSPDIRGLFNHDPNLVLGRTVSGTMTVTETDGGVEYLIDPPDTSYARDLRELLDRGDVSQSSFAFRVASDGYHWDEDEETGALVRVITNFSGLYDMSPVTYPAYRETVSGTRDEGSLLVGVERESMAPHGERDELAVPAVVEAEVGAPVEPWRLETVRRRIRLRAPA